MLQCNQFQAFLVIFEAMVLFLLLYFPFVLMVKSRCNWNSAFTLMMQHILYKKCMLYISCNVHGYTLHNCTSTKGPHLRLSWATHRLNGLQYQYEAFIWSKRLMYHSSCDAYSINVYYPLYFRSDIVDLLANAFRSPWNQVFPSFWMSFYHGCLCRARSCRFCIWRRT